MAVGGRVGLIVKVALAPGRGVKMNGLGEGAEEEAGEIEGGGRGRVGRLGDCGICVRALCRPVLGLSNCLRQHPFTTLSGPLPGIIFCVDSEQRGCLFGLSY